jgi:hypothetical protein
VKLKLRHALAFLAAAAFLVLPATAASASTPHHYTLGTESIRMVTLDGNHWTVTATGTFVTGGGTGIRVSPYEVAVNIGGCTFGAYLIATGPGSFPPGPGLGGQGVLLVTAGGTCLGSGQGDYSVHHAGLVTVVTAGRVTVAR